MFNLKEIACKTRCASPTSSWKKTILQSVADACGMAAHQQGLVWGDENLYLQRLKSELREAAGTGALARSRSAVQASSGQGLRFGF